MSESGEAKEIGQLQPCPYVFYDESLRATDVPYKVDINRKGFVELLQEMGVSDERINNIQIIVKRKDESLIHKAFGGAGGTYNPKKDEITICTDDAWQHYQGFLSVATRVANKTNKLPPWMDEFDSDFFYTKRLKNYLKNAPPERSLPFAEKIIRQAASRFLLRVLLHESKHAIDKENRGLEASHKVMAGVKAVTSMAMTVAVATNLPDMPLPLLSGISVTTGLLSVLLSHPFFYKLDPLEISARRFERKNKSNPKWHSLISITPKES